MENDQQTRREWLRRAAAGAGLALVWPRAAQDEQNAAPMPRNAPRDMPPPRAVQIMIGGAISGKTAEDGVPPDEFDPSGIYRQIMAGFPHIKKVVSITTALGPLAEESAEDQKKLFRRLGAEVTTVTSREEADRHEVARAIAEADMVFITGGKQDLVTDALIGTRGFSALQKRMHDPKFIFAGTSAGASCMSEIMVNGGRETGYVYTRPPRPGEDRRPVVEQMREGLGASPVIVDTHFTARGRLPRLKEMLAAHPGRVGIGVDEKTALVVENGTVRVLGRGAVLLARAAGTTDIEQQWLAGPDYQQEEDNTHDRTRFLAGGERWNADAKGFHLFKDVPAKPGLVAAKQSVRAP